LGVSLILQQFVRSVNWVLLIGIALFCLLFWWFVDFESPPDIQRIRNWVVAVMLPLCLGCRHRQVLSQLISCCHEALALKTLM